MSVQAPNPTSTGRDASHAAGGLMSPAEPNWWLRVMAVAAGLLAPLNAGIPIGDFDALRVPDVVGGIAILLWLMSGLQAFGPAMAAVLVLSSTVAALGAWAVRSGPDVVFVLRLAEVPVLAALGLWAFRRRVFGAFLSGVAVSVAVLSALLLYEAWLGRSRGWLALQSFDLRLAALIPNDRGGFVYQAGPILRPAGPFGHPNAAAGVLALGLAVIAALIPRLRESWSRCAAYLGVPLLLAGILVTGSRGGTVTGLGGLALGVLVPALRGRRRVALVWVVAGLVLAIGFLVTRGGGDYVRYAGTLFAPGDSPVVQGRVQSWSQALHLIASDPLTGIGRDALLQRLPATHNAFLFIAAASGLPLAFLLLVLAIHVAARALRVLAVRQADAAAAAAALLTGLALALFEDRSRDPVFLGLVASFAGVCLAAGRSREAGGREAHASPGQAATQRIPVGS